MGVVRGNTKVFYQLLGNTLLVSVTNFTVWFAITFCSAAWSTTTPRRR
jgi:DHA3 family multidrug efflux protein-like MFS transporter